MVKHAGAALDSLVMGDICVVIGPSGSGKTALLASLQHAAALDFHERPDMQLKVIPRNQQMIDLFSAFEQTLKNGQFPVTSNAEIFTYEFDLTITRRLMGYKMPFGELTQRFVVIDGPGAALIGNEGGNAMDVDDVLMKQYRNTILEHARVASGLVLCVDGTNERAVSAFSRYLPGLLANIAAPLPFLRFAICVTKADEHFYHHGPSAATAAENADPIRRAREIMHQVNLNILDGMCARNARIGVTWCSTYGFLQHGASNFDPTTRRLRQHDESQDAPVDRAKWRPRHVLDAFVFIATGAAPHTHLYPRA